MPAEAPVLFPVRSSRRRATPATAPEPLPALVERILGDETDPAIRRWLGDLLLHGERAHGTISAGGGAVEAVEAGLATGAE